MAEKATSNFAKYDVDKVEVKSILACSYFCKDKDFWLELCLFYASQFFIPVSCICKFVQLSAFLWQLDTVRFINLNCVYCHDNMLPSWQGHFCKRNHHHFYVYVCVRAPKIWRKKNVSIKQEFRLSRFFCFVFDYLYVRNNDGRGGFDTVTASDNQEGLNNHTCLNSSQ